MSQASRRFTVPIDGVGILGLFPYRPKYSMEGGLTAVAVEEYDWDNKVVTAVFQGDESVLDSIASEPDVLDVDRILG